MSSSPPSEPLQGEQPAASDRPVSPTPLPKEVLPPVQPPTAGFLMQLFFIPLIIVSIIVVVWLLFSWLAHMGSRPEDLVAALERADAGSWQSAKTLADVLRSPRNDELRHDTQLAGRLANLLQQQLQLGESETYPNSSTREEEQVVQQVFLRAYLCRTLGEFEVTTGVPVLIEAAGSERHPLEVKVRRASVEGLTRLLSRLPAADMQAYDDLLPVLLEGSQEREEDEAFLRQRVEDHSEMSREALQEATARWNAIEDRLLLRSTSVYALGLLGGSEATERLAFVLANDPHPDVRANAATGLARHGDGRAVDALVAMLDTTNEEIVAYEPTADHLWKRSDVMLSALNAVQLLIEKNPGSAELDRLRQAVVVVTEADVPKAVVIEARQVLKRIDDVRSRAAS